MTQPAWQVEDHDETNNFANHVNVPQLLVKIGQKVEKMDFPNTLYYASR